MSARLLKQAPHHLLFQVFNSVGTLSTHECLSQRAAFHLKGHLVSGRIFYAISAILQPPHAFLADTGTPRFLIIAGAMKLRENDKNAASVEGGRHRSWVPAPHNGTRGALFLSAGRIALVSDSGGSSSSYFIFFYSL